MITRRYALGGLFATPLLHFTPLSDEDLWARSLIAAARAQIGVTTGYDPAYTALDYPRGDIPRSTGVCTDVVIRAYRDSLDFDLQESVHEDMKANFDAYPNIWRLHRPDRNIDHRRVPNLETYFRRRGTAHSPPGPDDDAWMPGDIVTMRVGSRPHIGIVSDRPAASGRLGVIHNIGWGTQEEDILADFTLVTRNRFRPPNTGAGH